MTVNNSLNRKTPNFSVDGFVATVVTSISTNTLLTAAHHTVLVSGNTTLSLPSSSGISGREYIIKKTDTGTTSIIDPDGTETIDGNSTLSLTTQYQAVKIKSDGSNWTVIHNTASSGGGSLTVGTINAQTKSSDGLVISSDVLYAQTADGTYPGLVSTGTQTFAGDKTFSSPIIVNGISPTSDFNLNAPSGNALFFKYNNNTMITVGASVTFASQITYNGSNSRWTLRNNTSDGSDNKSVGIFGGGGESNPETRGAKAEIYGNEVSLKGGFLELHTGSVSGAVLDINNRSSNGTIKISTADTQRWTINANGDIIPFSSSLDLGSTDNKVDNVYCNNLYASNVSASIIDNVTSISGNTTLNATHNTILTTGTLTISLPTASGISGRKYTIKKTDSNATTVTIDPNGTETIDGFSTIDLYQSNSTIEIQSDGTNWKILFQCGLNLPSYTISNYSSDRAVDASSTTINELANVVCTLIGDINTAYLGGITNQYITNNGGAITIGESNSTKMHTFQGYTRESSPTIELTAGTTLDCSTQSTFRKAGGSATLTLTNLAENQTVTVLIESTGAAYSIGWAGYTFRWQWGTVPTPTASSGKYDLYTFTKINGIVYGSSVLEMS